MEGIIVGVILGLLIADIIRLHRRIRRMEEQGHE